MVRLQRSMGRLFTSKEVMNLYRWASVLSTALVIWWVIWFVLSFVTDVMHWAIAAIALLGSIGVCGAIWLSKPWFERKEKR